MLCRKIFVLLFLFAACMAVEAAASQPVVSDSRIKTIVYNESDVFSLLTHYGYQSSVEFAEKEEILTISLGDRIAWQVVPAGRRLFIRPLEENAHTNMTVITNKRSYQFDLRSSGGGKLKPNEELVYVARFYYPEEDEDIMVVPPIDSKAVVRATTPTSFYHINLEYTYTGPDSLAPVKIFDNGKATFFRMPYSVGNRLPAFFVVTPDGREIPLQASRAHNGYVYVPAVAKRFILRYGKDFVCIYNEK